MRTESGERMMMVYFPNPVTKRGQACDLCDSYLSVFTDPERLERPLFQLPNPLLQELPLWFLLGQRQSFLIRGPSLGCPAEPAVHICTG